MGSLRTLQGRGKGRRVQKQLNEALLIFDRQADDLSFVDGPVRRLLSRRNYKIADTAALKRRGAPDDPKRIGRNSSFDPRSASCFLGHASILLTISIVRDFAGQLKREVSTPQSGGWDELLG
jgi:hypothetical protein